MTKARNIKSAQRILAFNGNPTKRELALDVDDFVRFVSPVKGKAYGRIMDIEGSNARVVASNSKNNLRFGYGEKALTPLSNCIKFNIMEIPAKKLQAALRLRSVLSSE